MPTLIPRQKFNNKSTYPVLGFLALLLGLTLSGCGGAGLGGGGTTVETGFTLYNGYIQKGPFIEGGAVEAQELDQNLSPTGQSYDYSLVTDLGTYIPDNKFNSNYVSLTATGYYYDEVQDAVSSSPITLYAYADLKKESIVNVNILTTLAYQRIKFLVANSGLDFNTARIQAEKEVLAAFSIRNTKFDDFDTFDLKKQTIESNLLLAISSEFLLASAGDPAQLITDFQNDIADNGVIDNATTTSKLVDAAHNLDPDLVASNITARYRKDVTLSFAFKGANIAEWIDNDADGVIGKDEFVTSDAVASEYYKSPTYVVSADQDGKLVAATVGILKVNGKNSSSGTIVHTGDKISVTTQAPVKHNDSVTAYVTIGSEAVQKFTVVTDLIPISENTRITSVGTPSDLALSSDDSRLYIVSMPIVSTATLQQDFGGLYIYDVTDPAHLVQTEKVDPPITEVNSGLLTGFYGIALSSDGNRAYIADSNQHLQVYDTNSILPADLTKQYKAIGTYSDGAQYDITPSLTWNTDNPSIATVDSSGLVVAIGSGSSVITAGVGAISGNATMTVNSRTLSSIAVSPVDPTIAIGQKKQFTATGTYIDPADMTAKPTYQDITALVTWSSDNPAVASVDSNGVVTMISAGTATITAARTGATSGTSTVTVSSTLVSIIVSPINQTIPSGVTKQFTATGIYSDGSSHDITATVTWSSSDASVSIDASTGLATGNAVGSTTVTASLNSIMGMTNLTVNSETLSSIALSPAFPTIPVYVTEQFTATGTYTDGSQFDISSLVTWASVSPAKATISGSGLATALTIGTSVITADFDGKQGSTTLTVDSNVDLSSITVELKEPYTAHFPTRGKAISVIESPDSANVYVGESNYSVEQFDLTNNSFIDNSPSVPPWPTGFQPWGLTISPDNEQLIACSVKSPATALVDLTSKSLVATSNATSDIYIGNKQLFAVGANGTTLTFETIDTTDPSKLSDLSSSAHLGQGTANLPSSYDGSGIGVTYLQVTQYAYVIAMGRILLIDLSDLTAPKMRGSFDLSNWTNTSTLSLNPSIVVSSDGKMIYTSWRTTMYNLTVGN